MYIYYIYICIYIFFWSIISIFFCSHIPDEASHDGPAGQQQDQSNSADVLGVMAQAFHSPLWYQAIPRQSHPLFQLRHIVRGVLVWYMFIIYFIYLHVLYNIMTNILLNSFLLNVDVSFKCFTSFLAHSMFIWIISNVSRALEI